MENNVNSFYKIIFYIQGQKENSNLEREKSKTNRKKNKEKERNAAMNSLYLKILHLMPFRFTKFWKSYQLSPWMSIKCWSVSRKFTNALSTIGITVISYGIADLKTCKFVGRCCTRIIWCVTTVKYHKLPNLALF